MTTRRSNIVKRLDLCFRDSLTPRRIFTDPPAYWHTTNWFVIVYPNGAPSDSGLGYKEMYPLTSLSMIMENTENETKTVKQVPQA